MFSLNLIIVPQSTLKKNVEAVLLRCAIALLLKEVCYKGSNYFTYIKRVTFSVFNKYTH